MVARAPKHLLETLCRRGESQLEVFWLLADVAAEYKPVVEVRVEPCQGGAVGGVAEVKIAYGVEFGHFRCLVSAYVTRNDDGINGDDARKSTDPYFLGSRYQGV